MSVNTNKFSRVTLRTAGVGIGVADQYFARVSGISGPAGVIYYLKFSEFGPRGSTR